MSGELSTDARELVLYTENTGELYSQKKSILENIRRRVRNGTYDHAKAPALWQYWVDAGAKRYRKEFGTPGTPIFSPAVRREAAHYFANEEFKQLMAGDYGPPPALDAKLIARRQKGRAAHAPTRPLGKGVHGPLEYAQELVHEYRISHPHSRAQSITKLVKNTSSTKQEGCILCGAKGPTWAASYPQTKRAAAWRASHIATHVQGRGAHSPSGPRKFVQYFLYVDGGPRRGWYQSKAGALAAAKILIAKGHSVKVQRRTHSAVAPYRRVTIHERSPERKIGDIHGKPSEGDFVLIYGGDGRGGHDGFAVSRPYRLESMAVDEACALSRPGSYGGEVRVGRLTNGRMIEHGRARNGSFHRSSGSPHSLGRAINRTVGRATRAVGKFAKGLLGTKPTRRSRKGR